MNPVPNSTYKYQVGGFLKSDTPSYVKRQADEDFYNGLKAGEFCYVLNSRQMGKSSLMVRTKKDLQKDGFVCGVIDLQASTSKDITPSQWYLGFLRNLRSSFSLEVNVLTWWHEHEGLSSADRLSEFIEKVLLAKATQKIVIFVDEIDSVLKLNFKDDFFALIRACYNKRADNSTYERLTFALLGVATPSDLIQDKNRTPFNIGRAIELNGFQLHEVQSLAQGLVGKVSNSQTVLREVLAWTGGQPFLTQKLCKLILTADSPMKAGGEAKWVENLVRSQVIENWEFQDEPQHLRTIRDRLLSNEQRAPRLLGLYQQILQQGKVIADDRPEHMELRLSGLVVKQPGNLKVYNPIYKDVFNQNWVEKELANLRPPFFSEGLKGWEASNCQEKSWLLRGQPLRDAKKWAKGRSLTDSGRKFLDGSQELENEEVQRRYKEVQRRYKEVQRKKLIKLLKIVVLIITILLVVTIALVVVTYVQSQGIKETKHNIFTRSLLERAELITQPDLLPIRVALGIEAINRSKSIEVKPFLYDDLALLPGVNFAVDKDRGSVNAVAFSKNGEYLATAGLAWSTGLGGYACVFKRSNQGFQSSQCVANKNKVGNVNAMTFSPNGQYLATASVDGKTCVWDTISGKQIMCTDPKDGLKVGANAVSFSPDGKYLATAGADDEVWVFETNGYDPINLMEHNSDEHNSSVLAMTFSPKGHYLATASVDGTVRVWNTTVKKKPAKWELRHKLSHNEAVTNVAFSLDDKYLATASSDNTASVWDLTSGDEFARLIHNDGVNAIAFNPDKKSLLATASADGTARVWDLNSDRTVLRMGHKKEVNAKAFSDDGKHIVTASNDKTVVWSATSGYQQFVLPQEGVTHVTFSKDAKYLATVSSDIKGDNVIVLDTATGTPVLSLPIRNNVNSVAFSPDGKYLAIANLKHFELYSNPAGKKVPTQDMKHDQHIISVVFSQNGEYLATASRDNTACVWKVSTGEKVSNPCVSHDGPVETVTFSKDSKLLATASGDGTVKVLAISNGDNPKNLMHEAPVTAVSFSPDNKYLATVSNDNTAKVWEVSKVETPVATMNHKAPVIALCSPNDKQSPTVSSDTAMVSEPTENEKPIAIINHGEEPVTAVSFSQDGNYLATASKDNTLCVWKTTNYKTPVETILYKESVTAVTFRSDGERLVTMSGKTFSVLPWQRQTLIKDACDHLKRNLTREEWNKYVGDNEVYHKTCERLP